MKRVWVLCLIVAAAGLGCHRGNPNELAVTGQIEGVSVDAGSRVGGRVAEVLVREGDHVKAGQVLVKLEAHETQAVLDAAKAKLAQAEATLEKLKNGATPEQLRQAEAAFAQADEQYRMAVKGSRTQEKEAAQAAADAAKAARDQAKSDLERARKLYKQDVIAEQRYDQARHGYDAAEAQYQAALDRLNLVQSGAREEEIGMAKAARDRLKAALDEVKKGPRAEDIAAAQAIRDAAAADVARAETALREMVVPSPRDGVVESIDIHPGDLVKPGAVVRIVDPEDLELMVYVGAGVLGRLRLDQKVRLTTDSLGSETFEGTISHINEQGEYTPRNLQTQEERVQQVFGVKIKMNSNGGKLKAGMTATAHLDLAHGDKA